MNIQLFDQFICYFILRLYCLANELRTWLLYYSLPCLSGILLQPFLDHFAHLVEAIHLFLGTTITPNDISKGRECLTFFYKEFSLLYGMIFFLRLFLFKINLSSSRKYAAVFVV